MNQVDQLVKYPVSQWLELEALEGSTQTLQQMGGLIYLLCGFHPVSIV